MFTPEPKLKSPWKKIKTGGTSRHAKNLYVNKLTGRTRYMTTKEAKDALC